METVKSVHQSILVHDRTDSIDLTDAYLHVLIHPRSRKYLRFMFKGQVFHFTVLPFGVDFYQTDGRNSTIHASTCQPGISVPRWLAYKRSNSQLTNILHQILPTNYTKSRDHCKSKEVRCDTSPEIQVYRDGISDTTEYSQGTTGPSWFPTFDYQTISFPDASFAQTFLSLLGKLSAAADFCSPRQTTLTSASDVSFVFICLETTHSSNRSLHSNKQHDWIPLQMVDGHQVLRLGNVHSSSGTKYIPLSRMPVILDGELI